MQTSNSRDTKFVFWDRMVACTARSSSSTTSTDAASTTTASTAAATSVTSALLPATNSNARRVSDDALLPDTAATHMVSLSSTASAGVATTDVSLLNAYAGKWDHGHHTSVPGVFSSPTSTSAWKIVDGDRDRNAAMGATEGGAYSSRSIIIAVVLTVACMVFALAVVLIGRRCWGCRARPPLSTTLKGAVFEGYQPQGHEDARQQTDLAWENTNFGPLWKPFSPTSPAHPGRTMAGATAAGLADYNLASPGPRNDTDPAYAAIDEEGGTDYSEVAPHRRDVPNTVLAPTLSPSSFDNRNLHHTIRAAAAMPRHIDAWDTGVNAFDMFEAAFGGRNGDGNPMTPAFGGRHRLGRHGSGSPKMRQLEDSPIIKATTMRPTKDVTFQSDVPGVLDAPAPQTKLRVCASSDWNDTSSVNTSTAGLEYNTLTAGKLRVRTSSDWNDTSSINTSTAGSEYNTLTAGKLRVRASSDWNDTSSVNTSTAGSAYVQPGLQSQGDDDGQLYVEALLGINVLFSSFFLGERLVLFGFIWCIRFH